jgi:hypothetical protein
MQLDDAFIAHATRFAPHKRLPHGWDAGTIGKRYFRKHNNYVLFVSQTNHGWMVERLQPLSGPQEVLTHLLCDAPVLCPSPALAARLAWAFSPVPPPQYGLGWHDSFKI